MVLCICTLLAGALANILKNNMFTVTHSLIYYQPPVYLK